MYMINWFLCIRLNNTSVDWYIDRLAPLCMRFHNEHALTKCVDHLVHSLDVPSGVLIHVGWTISPAMLS